MLLRCWAMAAGSQPMATQAAAALSVSPFFTVNVGAASPSPGQTSATWAA